MPMPVVPTQVVQMLAELTPVVRTQEGLTQVEWTLVEQIQEV